MVKKMFLITMLLVGAAAPTTYGMEAGLGRPAATDKTPDEHWLERFVEAAKRGEGEVSLQGILAERKNKLSSIRFKVDNFGSEDVSLLFALAQYQDIPMSALRELFTALQVECGSKDKLQEFMDQKFTMNLAAVSFATFKQNETVIQIMAEYGVDVCVVDDSGLNLISWTKIVMDDLEIAEGSMVVFVEGVVAGRAAFEGTGHEMAVIPSQSTQPTKSRSWCSVACAGAAVLLAFVAGLAMSAS